MQGAANFRSLGANIVCPVALVMSIFFRYFSAFSCPKVGIEKLVFSGNFSLQNVLSVSKLEGAIGSFIFEVQIQKIC